jgi:hypothetical protein
MGLQQWGSGLPDVFGPAAPFVGNIDELAVYDYALSPAQIQNHYTVAGYTIKPVAGQIDPEESMCSTCSKGSPHTPEAQISRGAPVNTASGNFWHSFNGLSVPSRGLGLNFNMTYNSIRGAADTVQGVGDSTLGYGWTHSYNVSLAVDGTGVVTIRQENGDKLTFTPVASGYSAPPRVTATLVHNGDGTWTLKRNARETDTFDVNKRLVSETDANSPPSPTQLDAR